MYARYERGANELPIHHLIALYELYNISADYILGLTDKKKAQEIVHLSIVLIFIFTFLFIIQK